MVDSSTAIMPQDGIMSDSVEQLFADVAEAPSDPILGVNEAFNKDTADTKVNLSVGAYRDENGKPKVFDVVRTVEKEFVLNQGLDKEYLPIDGIPKLKELTQKLIFGDESESVKEGRVASIQSVSGTGALRVAGEFVKKNITAVKVVYVSRPSWAVHKQMFSVALGFEVREYPYWNQETRSLNIVGMLEALETAPPHSLIVLHSCAHNPTGLDPSENDWKRILRVVKDRHLLPLLDTAYQGFASGDLDKDAAVVRMFEAAKLPMFVCQSFAKNLGLYGERTGMLHVVCPSPAVAAICITQLKVCIRCLYSNPPLNGARILAAVLENEKYMKAWKHELRHVAGRITICRQRLRDSLVKLKTPGTWDHITNQIGMFSFTGLSAEQCKLLTSKWHIYLLSSGRISLAGLNEKNVEYVAKAIDDVVRCVAT